ncbi:resolvase [Clostridia bacterium]|nr:resolvase [Clostridia bacterium]
MGDSSSIQTQKMMLEKHCKDNGYRIYDYYVDDGYSGTNFDRPDFQRLLNDIEDGKVNLVITKDLSRLGRDYIMTGYYMEIYFVEKRVRYIALNDGVDTLKADNDIAPFKNILNDMYAKDISRKVRTAKRQRALNGMFISSQAPYGYKKHPENKNKLIIDEKAAEVVREIYRLALEGKGMVVITKTLRAKRIPTPWEYRHLNGDVRFERFGNGKDEGVNCKWVFATVNVIMKDRVYIGDMENHKYEIVSYKTKKLIPVPKDKHIIVENTHEPIVSREDYAKVQELIKARYTPSHHNHANIFRSVLFCAECGKKLTLATQLKAGKNVPFYRCAYHFRNPDKCKRNNRIFYSDLYEQVSGKIKEMFGLLNDREQLLERLKGKTAEKGKREKLIAERSKVEKRLAALSKVMKKLYEDYVAEVLDGENYQSFLNDYQREQREINERLTSINKELGKVNDYDKGFECLKVVADEYLACKELTAEMLHKLIERIEISPSQEENGEIRQRINIIYRFISTSI